MSDKSTMHGGGSGGKAAAKENTEQIPEAITSSVLKRAAAGIAAHLGIGKEVLQPEAAAAPNRTNHR